MKRCRCCGTGYEDVVFYCASCLKCNLCDSEMTAAEMYEHCTRHHVKYTVDNSYVRCVACPSGGKLPHLVEHVISSHAGSRMRV